MVGKSKSSKILMTVLAIKHYEDISRLDETYDHKERDRQIINQRRRQQYKK